MTDELFLNDPRVLALRERLERQGMEVGSGFESGIRGCFQRDEEWPGTVDAAIELADRLIEGGVDPERVLSDGVGAVLQCRGAASEPVADWLEPLGDFAQAVHAGGVALWSAVSYGLPFVAGLSMGSLDEFRSGLERYGQLLAGLEAQGVDTARLVTHGSRALGGVLQGHAWTLEPVCRLGERVGATQGGEPGWIWGIVVYEWAEVLLPSGKEAGHVDRSVFEGAMELLGDFLERASVAGMSAGSRLADGVATFARYGPRMVPFLEEWLGQVHALIRSMTAQGMSPYLPIGNGLGGIVGEVEPAELSEVLGFAVSLADRGIDPGGILYEAFMPAANSLGSPMAIELGRRLAEAGFDPFAILHRAAPAVGGAARSWPESGRADWLGECLELLTQAALSLHAVDLDGRKYFEDAVPYLAEQAGDAPSELLEGLRMGGQLASQGVDPGMTMAFGWSTVLDLGAKRPWLPNVARRIALELGSLGIDPYSTLSNAFPVLVKVTAGDQAEFKRLCTTLVDVTTALNSAGIDPRNVLYRDVSAMADVRGGDGADAFRELLERLRAVLAAMEDSDVSPRAFLEVGLPAIAREAREQPWRLDAGLAWATRLSSAGRDVGEVLEHALRWVASVDRGEAARFAQLLDATERASQRVPALKRSTFLSPLVEAAASISGGETASFESTLERTIAKLNLADDASDIDDSLASALPLLADIAAHDGHAFERLLQSARSEGERLFASGRWPSHLLWYGLRAIRLVTVGQPDEAVLCLSALSDQLVAEPVAVGRAIVEASDSVRWSMDRATALEVLARVAGEDAAGFRRGFPLAFGAARSLGGPDASGDASAHHLLRFAAAVPPSTARSFEETFGWLSAQLGDEAMRDAAARMANRLDECCFIVHRWPSAWSVLIRPAIRVHGPRSASILYSIRAIADRWVKQDSDLRVLGDVVTQFGVRVTELLDGLILAGLQSHVITDLTEEGDLLLRFAREVSIAEPQVYSRFRSIQRDAHLSDSQRRAEVEALQGTLRTLSESVHSGVVAEEEVEDRLFPLVLYHVFPPAMSSTSQLHVRVYASFDDHEDHILARDPGEDRRRTHSLRQGAWEERSGVEIDRSPWGFLMQVASDVGPATTEAAPKNEPSAELGWDLMGRWVEGRIGRGLPRRELMARVLRAARTAGFDLPAQADTPQQLIQCKEFLGDHVRDVVEQCLIHAREEDPERYERMVRAKFAPDTSIGAGLVKAMWVLATGIAAGEVSEADARQRLDRQLRHFDVDLARFPRELASCGSRDDVRALLQALQSTDFQIEVGKEQSRLVADFVGQDLSAMQGELYGREGQPGKLEYVLSDAAPPLEITTELTKRKAHAPIGLSEGVCVAQDQQLWDRPEFFQVVFWSPERIALGGMHVLIVEEDGEEYVTLPGINPSMQLLDIAEPGAVLDLALDHAWRLARRWGCAGVWVPVSPAIHSNRRAIHLEMIGRNWTKRETVEHPFSYSPYRYSFREVFDVPELAA